MEHLQPDNKKVALTDTEILDKIKKHTNFNGATFYSTDDPEVCVNNLDELPMDHFILINSAKEKASSGVHWVCLVRRTSRDDIDYVYYFDSLGNPPINNYYHIGTFNANVFHKSSVLFLDQRNKYQYDFDRVCGEWAACWGIALSNYISVNNPTFEELAVADIIGGAYQLYPSHVTRVLKANDANILRAYAKL